MKNVQLYFLPTSFYSQRARLSLEEKAIPYKETIVMLSENEQNQAWFLKINPDGEVPTLKVDGQYYSESENIVEVVDKLPSDIQTKLVPDPKTPEGEIVAFWRQKINEFKIPQITFGLAVFPEFSLEKSTGAIIPTAQGVRNRFENSLKETELLMDKHPDLKESYERKISLTKQRLVDFFDKQKVADVLDQTDVVMAQIEQQLTKMAVVGGLKQVDYFLCGGNFTAADINLCVLLGRFRMLGLLPRFADPKKYPSLNEYWQRVQKRPTVKKVVVNNVAETKRIMLGRKIRRYAGVAAALGIVGVAVWMAHKHLKK